MTDPEKKKVLVVEDDAIHRKVLAALVQQAKLEAVFTADGAAALEQLSSGSFDVVILDLNLPQMSGFDLLQRVRETAPDMLTRIIVVSGLGDAELSEIDPGQICSILRKPIDLAEFQRVVQQCIGG